MAPRTDRKTRNAEHTRQALIEAAAQVFAASGFAGARVDDIARLAGYNKSLIFQYFGDKEGLYRVIVAQMREGADQRYHEKVRPDQYLEGELTRDRLLAFLDHSITWIFTEWMIDPLKLQLVTWEMAEGRPIFQLPDRPISGTRTAALVLQKAIDLGFVHGAMEPVTLIKTMMGLPLIYLTSVPRDLEPADRLAMLQEMGEKVKVLLYSGMLKPVPSAH